MESQFTISSIVIVVWLIFPGVVFKRFYFQGQFTKQFGVGLFADRLITSLFWGIIVQIITFLFYSRIFGFTFTGIKNKVSGIYVNIIKNEMPNLTYEHLWYVLGYLAFLVIAAAVLGTITHQVIRLLKIDVKLDVFRFTNHWNYYFRGEIIHTKEFKALKKGKWLSTMVDILIDDSTEKNKMVSGFLTQYTISPKTGDLETIYLTGARRWSKSKEKFVTIPGDCLVVRFEKVVDLNLRYTFQILTKEQKKQFHFAKIFRSTLGMGAIFIALFPWYLHSGFFATILTIFLGIISWTLLLIILGNPFQPDPSAKFKRKELWIFSGIIVVFLTLILLLLHIPVVSFFKNL